MALRETPATRPNDPARFEALGRLATGLAHELNTPTQYLGDNAQFLRGVWQDLGPLFDAALRIRDRVEGPVSAEDVTAIVEALRTADLDYLREEVPKAIDQSIEGVQRVGDLVRAMKEFAGEEGAGQGAVDVNQVIENTLTVARNELKYVADAATELDRSLPPAFGHAGDIALALLQALIGAARAIAAAGGEGIRRRGRIVVSSRLSDGAVEICVARQPGAAGPDAAEGSNRTLVVRVPVAAA